MRRDELGILRFRYVRESEFNAMPEPRDLYTRYIVFKDDSDEILYEYLYGQRIETGANETGANEEDILNILNQFTYDKLEIDNKDANTLQEAKDYTYSKAEIDDKIDDIDGGGGHTSDFLNIINLDTSGKEKLTLYVINGQLGYEIEEEE